MYPVAATGNQVGVFPPGKFMAPTIISNLMVLFHSNPGKFCAHGYAFIVLVFARFPRFLCLYDILLRVKIHILRTSTVKTHLFCTPIWASMASDKAMYPPLSSLCSTHVCYFISMN